jgi:Bacteriophage minor capsid protein
MNQSEGVIYNLVGYLRSKLPTYIIYANKREAVAGQEFVPDNCILIKQSGGIEGKHFTFNRYTFQVLTRAVDAPDAQTMSYAIQRLIHNTLGLILPTITIGTVVYPQLITAAIYAIQAPASIGTDENGLEEFSNNYELTFTDE